MNERSSLANSTDDDSPIFSNIMVGESRQKRTNFENVFYDKNRGMFGSEPALENQGKALHWLKNEDEIFGCDYAVGDYIFTETKKKLYVINENKIKNILLHDIKKFITEFTTLMETEDYKYSLKHVPLAQINKLVLSDSSFINKQFVNFFKPASGSVLSQDVLTKILLALEPKEIMRASLVSKSFWSASRNAMLLRLRNDFDLAPAADQHPAPLYQEEYKKITYEIELAILYLHHTYLDDCFYCRVLYDAWENCSRLGSSFDNFLFAARNAKKKASYIPHEKPILEDNDKKYAEEFCNLLSKPSVINGDRVRELLLVICKVNAYHILQFFFRRHHDYFHHCPELQNNLPFLLQEAIISLQPKVVQILLPLLKDKQKNYLYRIRGEFIYLLNAQGDVFNTANTFGSLLYFSLHLGMNRNILLDSTRADIRDDHPALLEIIKLLLLYGYGQKQNCLFSLDESIILDESDIEPLIPVTPSVNNIDFLNDFISAKRSIPRPGHQHHDYFEINRNCIHLVNEIKEQKDLDPAYLELLDAIIEDRSLQKNDTGLKNFKSL